MNILVIGLGSMGRRRIRLMKSIYPENIIIGVDNNSERTMAVSKEYEIECSSNLGEIAKSKQLQCAFVCTSPISHNGIIRECLMRGIHVFSEINLIADGYLENMQLAKDKKLTLFLSSTPIYRAEMRTIDVLLKDNGLPVNYIYHVGQYLPDWHPWEDFHQFFVQDKRTNGCRELFAIELPWMVKTFGTIKDIHVIHNKITGLNINYDDNYLVQITHENGTSGVFCVDVVCRQAVRHLEVYNEQLFIEWMGTPETLKWKNLVTKEMELVENNKEYTRESGYSSFVNEYAYINEIKEFFKVLQTGKKMQYSFEEDMGILKIIDQIEGNESNLQQA